MMLRPEEIDLQFRWSGGTAIRLARRGKLPHVVLPNGDIRFDREIILATVRSVPGTEHIFQPLDRVLASLGAHPEKEEGEA